MEFSWPIFVVMLLLGAVQVALGVVLGRCLPTGSRKRKIGSASGDTGMKIDQKHLRFFADRLHRLVSGVYGEVGDHRNELFEVNRELANVQKDGSGKLTDSVLRSVARIMASNERLQSRLNSAEERLQQQNLQIEAHFTESRTDPLTGLMNRRAFDDALSFQGDQGNEPFALIMVDVDHFKKLNDEHGHPVGDEVLCSIGKRMESTIAGRGMLARYGGEEFAAIIPSADALQAQQITEQLRVAVAAAPFDHEQATLRLSVSLGVTLIGQGEKGCNGVKRADEALYFAKRSGRNCAFFHDGATCRRIEPCAKPAIPSEEDVVVEMPASAGARSLPPAQVPRVESFDEISAELRQRMAEVAGRWEM